MNELDKRFNDTNNSIILTSSIFLSSSPEYFNFKYPFLDDFLQNYKHFNINTIKLKAEFLSAKELLSGDSNAKHDLYSISKILLQLPQCYSETLKIITILMTLPVSTASNERFFSSLKQIKSYLRLTMGDDRLNDLLVVAVESDEESTINLDEELHVFASMKNRRYPLIS